MVSLTSCTNQAVLCCSAADKTVLLMKLVEDIHDCVDIMNNRSLKLASA